MTYSHDISNSDDTIDIRNVIERVEELREQRTPRFVAGWNMPGYMPDSTPEEFGDADDAKRYILDQIKRDEDDADTEEKAEELSGFAEDINLEGDEFSKLCEGRVYWVTLDGVMGLDEEETEELSTLETLLEECKGNGGDEQWEGDWYPVTLIRDSYFVEAMQELCEDIGDFPQGIPSYYVIDWEATAKNLQADYTSIDFGDVTYWTR